VIRKEEWAKTEVLSLLSPPSHFDLLFVLYLLGNQGSAADSHTTAETQTDNAEIEQGQLGSADLDGLRAALLISN
jgi:acyl-CoA-binding protein